MRFLPPMRREHRSVAPIALVLALTLAVAGPVPPVGATGGTRLWVARYNGPANDFDRATVVAVSPDGTRVYVTGYGISLATNDDYATVAFDAATGAQIWARRYGGSGGGFDKADALAVSPDGASVYVTGWGQGPRPDDDYATIAYDAATGAKRWVRRFNGPLGNDQATDLGVSPDGMRVYVTGSSYGPGTSADYATVAYDAATGAQLWVRRYNGPGSGFDQANALSVNPDGTAIYVTGRSPGSGTSEDYATVAYDAVTGAKLWVQRYNGPGGGVDRATALAVSPDGTSVYVTGRSLGSGSYDYATVAYGAVGGAKVWLRRYDGPGNGTDRGQAVAVSPDGAIVYVTGRSPGSGTSDDYATVAYDTATGATVWLHRYNGPGNGNDQASALAVSPDGTIVYVTGVSFGAGTSEDYATAAYDATTGTQVWLRRFNGPGNGLDFAYAVAVSPDGTRVYVTGQSFTSGTSTFYDYATVAYTTS